MTAKAPRTNRKASPNRPAQTADGWLRLHFTGTLLAATALAFALRAAVGAQLAHTPAVVSPMVGTDMETYARLALGIRSGIWPEVFDYQPFYYTVFLPLAWLFSPQGGQWPVILLQALVGAATVYLTGSAAARLFGRRAGLMAALLLAFSRLHIFYTPFMLLEVWFAFWCAAVFYCAVRLLKKPQLIDNQQVKIYVPDFAPPAGRHSGAPLWWWHALLGFCCAGAMLTRGNALLWLPGLLALVVWKGRRQWRLLLPHLLLMAICFALPILPYAIHNTRNSGSLQGASVAGGKVLALGNTPEAPPGGLEYPRTYYHWLHDAGEGRMSIPRHILQWVAKEPLAFLELKFRAFLLFWDAREIPNNVNIEIHGAQSSLLRVPFLMPWEILGSIGLAGFLLLFRRWHRGHLALAWLIVAYWGATSAFYLLARFRIGFLPLLCSAGAYFIDFLAGYLQKGPSQHRRPAGYPQFVLVVFLLLFSFYVVNFAYPLYQSFAEPAIQRRLRPNGLNLEFPREFVLYDHGPLSNVTTTVDVLQGIMLTKRFRLPPELRAKLAYEGVDRMARQRLMLLVQAPPASLHAEPAATLTYNGTRLAAKPMLQIHRGTLWLVFEFVAPLPSEGTQAIFQLDLGPSPSLPHFAFGLDATRDYGRTSLRIPGVDEQVVNQEAVVEWIIPRRFGLPPLAD